MTTNTIIKRDGRKVPFDKAKIQLAIYKAFTEVDGSVSDFAKEKANNIATYIEEKSMEKPLGIEEIQDMVENGLMRTSRKDVARAYITYRNERNRLRGNLIDNELEEFLSGESEYWNTENSNKNPRTVTTQRDYIAGITSTEITMRKLLPEDVVDAHKEGIIHFHDADYFLQNALTNCELINLEDMLQNGTVINDVLIEKPHKLITAATIATQIILGVTSSTYGGCTISLTHLAPFVRDSYNRYYKKYKDYGLSEEQCKDLATADIKLEVNAAVQTFNYQCNSMSNVNGQSPFLSVFMYLGETEEYKEELAMLIEEFLNQRIVGFKNKKGVYVTPAFPKLLYVLEEDNIHEDSKYWYLTQLAAKCTAKRLVPDYISEKKMLELKGDCYPCMGCRSFPTPDRFTDNPEVKKNLSKAKNYVEGKHKYYGRFNMGVVTLNLVDLALSSGKDFDKFWELFEERTELCHRALQCRINRLSKITSDAAPILWQHGAMARLEPGETLYDIMHHGYSTISLGYAGLYECVKYMTDESHSHGKGKEFGLKVMEALNDKCKQWKAEEDIDYSLYGTPIESTTYKFAKCLQKRFGVIPDITDHTYITNSYHICVREEIDAFEKLSIESEYQALSPGGCISYVETPNMQNNLDAVLSVIKYIYETIVYAELNTKSDYCEVCGYDGEIEIKGEQKKLFWRCPNCGNTDQSKMHVSRRTCGYIGSQFWNQGRTEEIKDRVLHL